jgi:hypothetical protein
MKRFLIIQPIIFIFALITVDIKASSYSTFAGAPEKEASEKNKKCKQVKRAACASVILGGAVTGIVFCCIRMNGYCPGITNIDRMDGQCWQASGLTCCSQPTVMQGDQMPGISSGEELHKSITNIMQRADCDSGIGCLQEIPCANLNTSSPLYYKNFDPCEIKPNVTTLRHRKVKPSLAQIIKPKESDKKK